MVMAGRPVSGVARGTVGFDVDRGGVEMRDLMKELVFDAVRDLVSLDDVECRFDAAAVEIIVVKRGDGEFPIAPPLGDSIDGLGAASVGQEVQSSYAWSTFARR